MAMGCRQFDNYRWSGESRDQYIKHNLDKNKPIHIIGIGDKIPLVDVSIVQ